MTLDSPPIIIRSADEEDGPDDSQWQEQIAQLLRRPENLRSVHQPVVDLRTGACVGYEALVRVAEWPARSPRPWFRAASRTGLGAHLEGAAMAASLRARATLPGERFVLINVTPSCLPDPAVADVLADEDDLVGVILSPTEPAELAGPGPGRETLDALRERGVMVAARLAEVGRAELTALLALRPDLIALDGPLVRDAHTDPVRQRLVRLAVELARDLDASVLARGVEALDDARLLQTAGVQLGHGWLLGRARPGFLPPPDEVTSWLRAAWEESSTLTRLGRLAVPVPRTGDRMAEHEPWRAGVGADGRLRTLYRQDGSPVAAQDLLRIKASQPIRAAARRILGADQRRRAHGVVAVVDDDGRFVGLAESDAVLAEAIDQPDAD